MQLKGASKNIPLFLRAQDRTFIITDPFITSLSFKKKNVSNGGLIVHLTTAKKKSKWPTLIYKSSLKMFLLQVVPQNILIAP